MENFFNEAISTSRKRKSVTFSNENKKPTKTEFQLSLYPLSILKDVSGAKRGESVLSTDWK